MCRMILGLTAVFLFGVSAIWADTLWYGGDASGFGVFANAISQPFGDTWVYNNFVVPPRRWLLADHGGVQQQHFLQ